MASLTDVAKAARVSLTTASMVLNKGKQENRVSEACANRVRTVAQKLGYFPNYHARSMKLGRAEMLAVALDVGYLDSQPAFVSELGTSYFGQLIGSIELETRNLGYQMTIVGPDRAHRAPDRGWLGIRQRQFDGLIVPGVVVRTDRTSFLEDAPAAPIVVVEYRGKTDLPVVDYDEPAAVAVAIDHLASLGHKNLLWVGFNEPNNSRAESRRQLAMQHMGAAGLKMSSCLFELGDWSARPSLLDAAGEEVSKYLHQQPRDFTAVICYNDAVAIGACEALMQAGLAVPKDVSVIGFDDAEASLCIPRLTTISHQLAAMGKRAVEMVMEMVSEPESIKSYRGKRENIQPSLIVRRSTGPASSKP